MRLIAVFLVVALTGCVNTPYRADYTKVDLDPARYEQDKKQCRDDAWDAALVTTGGQYSGDVFLHFLQRNMIECMKKKNYEPIGIHPDAYKQTL